MKYKVAANSNKYLYDIEADKNGFLINGKLTNIDLRPIGKSTFHILYNNRSFLADVIELNRAEKYCVIKVNGNIYRMEIKDKFDTLLHQLGLDSTQKHKINEIKAPMPGLVLEILVQGGDNVKKGDNLFILEAMKMENIIKSPVDGIIKAVKAASGDKVEKGQPIILFG